MLVKVNDHPLGHRHPIQGDPPALKRRTYQPNRSTSDHGYSRAAGTEGGNRHHSVKDVHASR